MVDGQAFESTRRSKWARTCVRLQPQALRSSLRLKVVLPLVLFLDQFADAAKQAAGLRRQLVQGAAQNFRRKLVRQRDVIEGDFDIGLSAWKGSRFALVLVQQGDGVDERQYFSWSRRLRVRPVAKVKAGA